MSVASRSSKRRRHLMEAMVNGVTKGLAISSYHVVCQLFDKHHGLGSHASSC